MFNPSRLEAAHAQLIDRMDALTLALSDFPRTDQQHAPAYRDWQMFRWPQSVTLNGSGVGTVSFQGQMIRPGWEAEILRYAIVVQGASAAASVTVYVGEPDPLNAPVVDFASQLFGSSPSRAASQSMPPVWLTNGEYLTFGIAGAVAAQQASVTLQGRMREL